MHLVKNTDHTKFVVAPVVGWQSSPKDYIKAIKSEEIL